MVARRSNLILILCLVVIFINICFIKVKANSENENINWIDYNSDNFLTSEYANSEDFFAFGASISNTIRWGFANNEGIVVIAPEYDQVEGFSEGFAAVAAPNSSFYTKESSLEFMWGYIDKNNNQIGEFKYQKANKFQEGFAAVATGTMWNYKWGFIDS